MSYKNFHNRGGFRRKGLFGLGLDIPYVDSQGSNKTAHASNAQNCSDDPGSARSLQQMLNDLGYGPLVVDGILGNATFKALDLFASQTGASYTKGTIPKGSICDAVINAWTAIKGTPVGGSLPIATGSGTIQRVTAVIPGSGPAAAATHVFPSYMLRSGALATVEDWWSNQGTVTKVGIVAGGALLIGGLIYSIKK